MSASMSTKHRRSAGQHDGVHRRRPGERRRDHLVAGLQIEPEHRQVQPGGRRGHRQRVRRAVTAAANSCSNCAVRGPRGDPPGAEALDDVGDLLLADRRPGKRNLHRASCCAPLRPLWFDELAREALEAFEVVRQAAVDGSAGSWPWRRRRRRPRRSRGPARCRRRYRRQAAARGSGRRRSRARHCGDWRARSSIAPSCVEPEAERIPAVGEGQGAAQRARRAAADPDRQAFLHGAGVDPRSRRTGSASRRRPGCPARAPRAGPAGRPRSASPRPAKSTPSSSNSSRRLPTPTPRITRPPESRSSVP